jgi:N-acyl-D-amino-acid deacylase
MAKSGSVLIRGAKVVDGTGNPWVAGNVLIEGDRIARVWPLRDVAGDPPADEVVDAAGCVVCPGFIDIISHSILPLLRDGRSLSKITQGVTTEIMGEAWTPSPVGGHISDPFGNRISDEQLPGWREKGSSWRRFGQWLDATAEHGVSVNIGSFVGGGTVRAYTCGWRMGDATGDETRAMRQVMAESMEDGAFGIATALIYPPGCYAGKAELIELAQVIRQYGGVYITHIRSEAAGLLEALDEAIDLGRQTGCPVEIYHLKASGRGNWHLMDQAIERIEQARAEGIDITADMYPYVASGTGLSAMVPHWAAEGNKLFENLRDPGVRAQLRAEMEAGRGEWNIAVEHVMPVGFHKPEHKQYVGKRLSEIADLRGQPWPEAVMDLLAAEGQRIFTMYFSMSEKNLSRQLKLPWISIGTDAGGVDPAAQSSPLHPRGYGTYPRILGKYVREEKALTLEDAVRKMSWAVAARLGIRDRGLLKEGCLADVVVFDPRTIIDRSTFTEPHQLSQGVRDVWVNGVRVLCDGRHTGAKPGQVVWGPGRR